MTTPHQGPGMYPQGDREAAVRWLASLDTSQQVALQRSISTHQALGPMYNAAAATVRSFHQTKARLSDYAQRLASGARAAGQAVSATVGQAREAAGNRATQVGQSTSARAGAARDAVTSTAAQLSQRAGDAVRGARDGISQTAQLTGTAAAEAAQRAVIGATLAGQQAAATGRQVAEAGRQAVEAGRQAPGNVSRWFNEQITKAATKSAAVMSAVAEGRKDPAVASASENLHLPTLMRVQDHLTEIAAATTPEQGQAALARFAQLVDSARQQSPEISTGAEQTEGGTGKHRLLTNPVSVLDANAPASGAPSGNVTAQQGEAAKPATGAAVKLDKPQTPER